MLGDQPNIWDAVPSYKDMNEKNACLKAGSLIAAWTLVAILTYLFTLNFVASMGAGAIMIIFFIAAFNDEFFSLRHVFSTFIRKYSTFDPFEDLMFWQLKDEPLTLFFSNKKDLTVGGTRVFKIQVIPENVHATLIEFIRAISNKNVRAPYAFQVVQSPFHNASSDIMHSPLQARQVNESSEHSYKTDVYFSVHHRVKGTFNRTNLKRLIDELDSFSSALKSSFSGTFHHYEIKQLAGTSLINAINFFFTRTKNNSLPDSEKNEKNATVWFKTDLSNYLIKSLFCAFFIGYVSYLMSQIDFSVQFIVVLDTILLFIIILGWWKELIFQISRRRMLSNKNLRLIGLFNEVKFYKFNKMPDTLFSCLNNEQLVGAKSFNAKFVSPPPYCNPNRFYSALINHGLHFNYTVVATPIGWYHFFKEGFKYLRVKTQNSLLKSMDWIDSDEKGEKWLLSKAGAWRVIIILSIVTYERVSSLNPENILKYATELEKTLDKKARVARDAFHMYFQNFELVPLQRRYLESGFVVESLKTKIFASNGTHLNYLLFDGATLSHVTKLADELKKGIRTQIASEFNAPLYLENFITIGWTINTEFLEEEIPAGFGREQLSNLLVVNGIPESREYLTMKIVAELLKAGVPSIVFDFTGNWSRLIRYFEGSRHENDILYFKLGTSFTANLTNSGIENDENGPEYLDLVFDAYAMAFKQDRRTAENVKNIMLKSQDLEVDLSSLGLGAQFEPKWEKSQNSSLVASLNDFFLQKNLFFSIDRTEAHNDLKAEELLNNFKTIILDFSAVKDIEFQVFASFVIISKLIHRVNRAVDHVEKILVVPNVDLFFDGNYLDNVLKNYSKINNFLEPLAKEGFGFLFSANQVHYLHGNLFNYFSNLISFKATDKRDIAALINIMNLQELEGTGYYSSKRTNTYQVKFLTNMREDTVLVKRSDVEQPFPVKLQSQEMREVAPLTFEEMIVYMKIQGHDLKSSEQKLSESVKKTIFEKDLGDFATFTEEIMNFLGALSSIHEIGNLYERKIKEELLKYIYSKARKIDDNKKAIKKIRNALFDALVMNGYLIEAHPKKAGGSEPVGASYMVGPQYQKAVDDYYEVKKKSYSEIAQETIEKETDDNTFNGKEIFKEPLDDARNQELKDAIVKNVGILVHGIYKMSKLIDSQSWEEALDVGIGCFRDFLNNLRKKFGELYEDNPFVKKDLDTLFTSLNRTGYFAKEEIFEIIQQLKTTERNEIEVKKVYNLLSNFLNRILRQINDLKGEQNF